MNSWWIFLYVGAVLSGNFLNLVGLPGNWWIVFSSGLVALLAPAGLRTSVSWFSVFIMMCVAVLAEVYEFFGAVKELRKKSKPRVSLFALIGSILGSIFGGLIGAPFFPFGVIFGIIFFASVGAMMGAMFGEIGSAKAQGEVWQTGKIAFWGRLFGSVVKILVGAILSVYAVLVVIL